MITIRIKNAATFAEVIANLIKNGIVISKAEECNGSFYIHLTGGF